MTEIKPDELTVDDVYAIAQALRHCNKQDAYIFTRTGEERDEIIDYYDLYKRFSGKKILSNQKLRRLIEEMHINTKDTISITPRIINNFCKRLLDEVEKE